MDGYSLIIVSLAALAAGFVNAVAGGGTLISFPVMVALGIPPVVANSTNTIALCPGYFAGVFGQRKDFQSQKATLWKILPVSISGGIIGGLLLLNTGENSFRLIVPYLILLAALLLAFQAPLRTWMISRNSVSAKKSKTWMFILIFFASVYGGYFGAGLGVILMAVLGFVINDTLTKLNVLKQATSLSINVAAALYFSFFGNIEWLVVMVMFAGSMCGGLIGGSLAGKINSNILRWIIVAAGIVVALYYFLK